MRVKSHCKSDLLHHVPVTFPPKLDLLVGASLGALNIIHHQGLNAKFVFPSYTNEAKCNGNSASAALNKWMKGHTEKGVVHSFRHSLRDRLREAGVDREIIDQLGGWSVSNVGESYGAGHSLGKNMRLWKELSTPHNLLA